MKRFFFLCILAISLSIQGWSTECPFAALTVKMKEDRIVLTEENHRAFDRERTNLIEAYTTLTQRFKEMDHVVKMKFMALMMETHLYLFGEAGGAKSAISRAIDNMPIWNPETGEYERNVFAIQMQQLLGDQPFKGFIDHEKLDANQEGQYKNLRRKVKAEEVQNRGTMIQFERALIDELEKGNPIAAAAILDVLNEKIAQYGGIVVKVNTKSVTTTSNMTPYEFLEMLSSLGMESTAKPFLDRLVFKVYAHNWITDQALRIAAKKDAEQRHRDKKLKYLTNPKGIRSGKDAQELDPDSLIDIKLPPVDFSWLGAWTSRLRMEPDALSVSDQVFNKLRTQYGDKRMETKADYASNPHDPGVLPPYFPPFIFSTRNYLEYTDPTIKTSLLLDLLLVPRSVLSSRALLEFLADGGGTVSMRSTYRDSQLATTNAVGGARLVLGEGGKKWKLEWGKQLDALIASPLDAAEKANRQYIQWEREQYQAAWEPVVEGIQQQKVVGSSLLQDLANKLGLATKSRAKITDIEELLFYLHQQDVSNSGN